MSLSIGQIFSIILFSIGFITSIILFYYGKRAYAIYTFIISLIISVALFFLMKSDLPAGWCEAGETRDCCENGCWDCSNGYTQSAIQTCQSDNTWSVGPQVNCGTDENGNMTYKDTITSPGKCVPANCVASNPDNNGNETYTCIWNNNTSSWNLWVNDEPSSMTTDLDGNPICGSGNGLSFPSGPALNWWENQNVSFTRYCHIGSVSNTNSGFWSNAKNQYDSWKCPSGYQPDWSNYSCDQGNGETCTPYNPSTDGEPCNGNNCPGYEDQNISQYNFIDSSLCKDPAGMADNTSWVEVCNEAGTGYFTATNGSSCFALRCGQDQLTQASYMWNITTSEPQCQFQLQPPYPMALNDYYTTYLLNVAAPGKAVTIIDSGPADIYEMRLINDPSVSPAQQALFYTWQTGGNYLIFYYNSGNTSSCQKIEYAFDVDVQCDMDGSCLSSSLKLTSHNRNQYQVSQWTWDKTTGYIYTSYLNSNPSSPCSCNIYLGLSTDDPSQTQYVTAMLEPDDTCIWYSPCYGTDYHQNPSAGGGASSNNVCAVFGNPQC